MKTTQELTENQKWLQSKANPVIEAEVIKVIHGLITSKTWRGRVSFTKVVNRVAKNLNIDDKYEVKSTIGYSQKFWEDYMIVGKHELYIVEENSN